MAVIAKCPACHNKQSLKHAACTRCGTPVPGHEGTVYYVVTSDGARKVWEAAGGDIERARALDAERRRETMHRRAQRMMENISRAEEPGTPEAEADAVRGFLYELFKSFFADELDDDLIGSWRRIIPAIAGRGASRDFDRSTAHALEALDALTDEQIVDEHQSLFIDPFADDSVNLTASFHAEGANMGMTLVRLRDELMTLRFLPAEEFTGTEDMAPFLFELSAGLIEDDAATREDQRRLFENFVEPLMISLGGTLKEHPRAVFFAAVGAMLIAFADLERSFLQQFASAAG